MHVKQANDLAWLDHKTNIYENPVDKRREELKQICIRKEINNPIIGDLYDEKKKDPTVIRQTFRDRIIQKADNPDIYRLYTKDRREVMGDCKRKGEVYLKKMAEEQEMTILKAIYYVEGDLNLDRQQKRKLRAAGIIKRPRRNNVNT